MTLEELNKKLEELTPKLETSLKENEELKKLVEKEKARADDAEKMLASVKIEGLTKKVEIPQKEEEEEVVFDFK